MNPITEINSELTELADLCKALSHPARIRIVLYLRQMEQCVCGQIVDQLPLAQSTVSQHLKALKNAGLIQGIVSGPSTCYCLNLKKLERFKYLIEHLF